MRERFDLVILGSGSTAFAAAIRAAELGRTAVMTESRELGGTCVNRGCLPSKDLIEAARVYWDAAHPRFPGLGGKTLDLDFRALIAGKDEVIRDYRGHKYEAMLGESERIELARGDAAFVDAHTVEVVGRRLVGDQVLIATGSRPAIPQVAGVSDVPYLTSDLLSSEPDLELAEQPRSLVILGAGYIALELGQLFARLGTRVTILSRSRRILHDEEPEVSAALAEALIGEGIDLRTSVEITGVRRDGEGVAVAIRSGERGDEVAAERLLVAAGRTPNTDRIGVERAGVALDEHGFVRVDGELRTSVAHVWAAGDVIGTQAGSEMATPVGAHDGNIAAGNALGAERRRADHDVIPRTIFTDPQVAVVGLTDRQANHAGIACRCNTVPMHLVPRAGAARAERGIVKMVIERDTARVRGVSMVGRDAGEVIHEAAMGLRFGATARDFIDLIHVYPTMAEALKLAALSFYKDVSKLSCCAE